jgi:hypothetical protein
MKRLTAAALALVLVGSAAACGGADPSPLDLTPSGTLVTDTFTGVVPVAGLDSHNFSITTGGNSISVTLVSAGPPATITMGLGVGTPSSTGACSILTNGAVQTPASTTAQLNGTGFNAGTYCVVVGDIGNALQPITYTVTVAHT